jgi:GntR family transcriptional regulator
VDRKASKRGSIEPTLLPEPVSRESSLPFYQQIKQWFYAELRKGNLRPGMRLPSETRLAEAFGTSRIVVRQALQEMVQEGLLTRKQGLGTFVALPKVQEGLVQRLTGFYEDMQARGLSVRTRVTCMEVVPVGEPVASYLQISPGEPVYKLGRLRFVEREPILHVVSYLPYHLCPGLYQMDFEQNSLYRILEEHYGLRIARGRRSIEAVLATPREAGLLGIQKGAPLILLRSIVYLEDGRPLEYYEAKHRGDRCAFEVELVREGRTYSVPSGPAFEGMWAKDPEIGAIKVGRRR